VLIDIGVEKSLDDKEYLFKYNVKGAMIFLSIIGTLICGSDLFENWANSKLPVY
jgi:hypothetical protein